MSVSDLIEAIDLDEFLDFEALDWKVTSGGDNLNLRECPFCGDESWRVYMSRSKKRGLCFKGDCNARFNLFSFVRQRLGGSNAAAIRHLESFAGRVCRPVEGASVSRTPTTPEGWELPCSVSLPTPEGMTHPYLIERGILPATQSRFGLRWCEEGWYSYEDVTGTPRRMSFAQRVLLPVHDLDGRLVTFVGRDVTGVAEVRYLFPPLLPAAGKFFYGGEHLPGAEHLILGEGPFDAIAIHQAIKDHPDYRRCAAAGSFGLSIGHADEGGNDQLGRLIRLKAQGLKRLTIIWDGERKALISALRHAEVTTRAGIPTHIATLPEDSDPGEVDSGTIRRAVERAPAWSPELQIRWGLLSPYR